MNLRFANKRNLVSYVQDECRRALRNARRLFCFFFLDNHVTEGEPVCANCLLAEFLVNSKAAKASEVRL